MRGVYYGVTPDGYKLAVPYSYQLDWCQSNSVTIGEMLCDEDFREIMVEDYLAALMEQVLEEQAKEQRRQKRKQQELEQKRRSEEYRKECVWADSANEPEDPIEAKEDLINYWIDRGLCEESAMQMAGARRSGWNGCNGGPRNVCLDEEWAKFEW